MLAPPPVPPQNTLTEAERAEGWKLLFDGRTTAGWRGYAQKEMPKNWSVTDGVLVNAGGGGDIVTLDDSADFELALEWKISKGGNSGIFFHVSEDHTYPWETGPEMQILDNDDHPDGKNPLTSLASFKAFTANIAERCEIQPANTSATAIGAYRADDAPP